MTAAPTTAPGIVALADAEAVPLAEGDLPRSTYDLVRRAAATWPEETASTWLADPAAPERALALSFAETAERVTRLANALVRLGVGRTDAVTLCSPNVSGLWVATLAAQAAGIAAPVNPALGRERVVELARRVRSRVVVAAGPEVDPTVWDTALAVAAETGAVAVLALRPDDATGSAPRLPTRDGLVVAWADDLAAVEPASELTAAEPGPDDLAAYFHTGGTTGAPKIAVHTHANEVVCAWGVAVSGGIGPGETMLAGLPLFHVNALVVTGLAPMVRGQHALWPGPLGYRAPALYGGFWRLVERYGVVGMSAVPTVYGTLLDVPVDADISSLRLPVVGAAPLPAAVRDGFAAHTGVPLLEGYGLTEATCASCFTRPGAASPGSVGTRLPYQHLKAVRVDADGRWTDLPPGETGTLAISGPAVFAGYLVGHDGGRPVVERGAHVRDGWLDTGDLGEVDVDGRVLLHGRAKDLIIRGGHNIDPRVIEEALLRHPSVVAAAAVGQPDLRSGEVPVAYVVLTPGAGADPAELVAWARAEVGEPAAAPQHVRPVDAIPVTAVGKPFKPALVADAAACVARDLLRTAGIDAAVAPLLHEGRAGVDVTDVGDLETAAHALSALPVVVRIRR
ncbi:acyl-CoA synthetase [Nocardioides sp.]|uniref:acyl-CoA synthetase n=1 Tax=Nocardioides sp. TaxID=35761 RepID=UPI00378395D1